MSCKCSGPISARLRYWAIVNPEDVTKFTRVECSICERVWKTTAAYVGRITKGVAR